MAVLHGNLKKLAVLAVLLLVCLLAVGWGYTQVRAAAADRAEYRIVNDEYSQVLAPADPAAGLDQTLQLKAGEPLYGVRLLFATYERVAQGQLTAQLLDGAGQPVATAACNLTELLDNTFYGLVFDRPYTAPADGAYTLHLSFAPLTEEDRVGLHCSQGAVEGFALAQADGQALDATAALQYMTDYTGRWPSRGFLLIGLLCTVGVVGAAALLRWGRTPHLRAAFCLAGAALGVAFALATPPLGGPDEYVHFAGSYAAASRLMGQPDYDDEGGLWVRDCDEPYVTAETGPADAFVYHRVFSTLTEHGCARDLLHAVEVRSPGSMVQLLYLPQTLGVLLARLLGLGFTGLILAGRLCNLAVYLALDAFALFAHRVGVAGQEKQGQGFWHPGQNRWVVQPQDAGEHAVVGVQGEREHAALIGAVLVHLGGVAVEPVLRGAALQTLVVPGKREAGHQLAAVLPAEEDGQHPADGFCQLYQGFGLETGAHDDGTGELTAPLAQVLPGVERAHAVPQQEIGHIRVECFRQHGHGVQVIQHGAVAVRLGKVAVIGFGADGAAVAQMIVPRD